jgi:hypothetical protein
VSTCTHGNGWVVMLVELYIYHDTHLRSAELCFYSF